jgi:cell division GTPase FtsZ
MNCAEDKKCPAKLYPNENCWDIFKEADSSSFNICQDCIVYITRQEDATLSEKEVEQVMLKKGIALSIVEARAEKSIIES